jgi:hypothetical protein
MLVPGMAQNDLLLEIVMLIATIATDPSVFIYFFIIIVIIIILILLFLYLLLLLLF